MNLNGAEVVRNGQLPDGQGTVDLLRLQDGRVVIRRFAQRGRITTVMDKREVHMKGDSLLEPLTLETGLTVFDRLMAGEPEASCFVFHHSDTPSSMRKTETEDRFTSTGRKFWRHPDAMLAYRAGGPKSVISTHVSPEGACNLKCPYCSVTYRQTASRIELPRIQDYIMKLRTRGLKAVILTGGGEPTVYPAFNELVTWLKKECGLSIGLITNGTLTHRVSPEAWQAFSWVRVSINLFDGWQQKIGLPREYLSPDCVVGCSLVYTAEHELTEAIQMDRDSDLRRVGQFATALGASYVRLLPNCTLDACSLLAQHAALERAIARLDDRRFFHQHKMHRTPRAHVCHQAYFRPYLGEEPWHEDGRPGAVFPCDSVVLNDGAQRFATKYQLCRPEDILDFLDDKTPVRFDPHGDCTSCVFADTVDMLDDWHRGGPDRFAEHASPILHEEFP